jgi:hemoglobin
MTTRAEKISKKKQETGIDEAMIKKLVHAFYDKIKTDTILVPIFNERITDWEPHLQRMCDFWSSATLKSGRYDGNPMMKHHPLPIDGRFFDHWLGLFAQTASEICPPKAADVFKQKSATIAQSLELGIAIKNGMLPIKGQRYINDELVCDEK